MTDKQMGLDAPYDRESLLDECIERLGKERVTDPSEWHEDETEAYNSAVDYCIGALIAMKEEAVSASSEMVAHSGETELEVIAHQEATIQRLERELVDAKKLVDRAYKMFWMSGARVVEHNPDHNNPIIAWMADARPFMETLPSIADLNAALAAARKEEK